MRDPRRPLASTLPDTIVSYEIFILAASIYLLKTGKAALPMASEIAAHCACAAVFLIVLVPLGTIGANQLAEEEAGRLQLTHLQAQHDPTAAPDALDAARTKYGHGVDEFSGLVSAVTRVWLGLFCVALGLWVAMRFVVLKNLEREWAEVRQLRHYFDTMDHCFSAHATPHARWYQRSGGAILEVVPLFFCVILCLLDAGVMPAIRCCDQIHVASGVRGGRRYGCRQHRLDARGDWS